MENEVMFIKLDDIIPNRFQPREVFDEEALNKLADSIRRHGVIEPIIVRPVSNKFEIVAGERRYKASVLAGLTKIPAIVKQMDDKESSIVAYIENEHRSGVSAIEEARTIDRLLKNNNMTQEELAHELGINQSTLANKLRLLSLPMIIQESLMHNEISERHARSLLSVKDEQKQIELLNKIKDQRMTVRELDSEIKSMNNSDNNQMNDYISNNFATSLPPETTPPMNTNYTNDNFLTSEPTETIDTNYINNNFTAPEQPASMNTNYINNPDFGSNLPQNDLYGGINNDTLSSENTKDNSFMDYVNNFDSNSTIPDLNNDVSNQGMDSFLNNYENNNTLNEYNNSLDNNIMNNANISQPSDDDPSFMNFLNNYDNTYPPIEDVKQEEEPVETPKEYNDLFNPNIVNNNPPVESNSYLDINNSYNESNNSGVMINDVNPPITSDFNNNSYIESNPNYVDVSKEVVISDVDEIINKLKVVVDDIKATSKFKIDTDEINYDDIYQITIKIDKRDF